MIIFKRSKDLQFYLINIKSAKATTNFVPTIEALHFKSKIGNLKSKIGFVPTMGALHNGHLSLIEQCKKQTGLTVCSIFVNPTQFNNPEDFKKYPVTIEQDILFLEEHGCDILFLPDEKEIYPDAESKNKHYELGYLETILEGKYRPGHFQGVCLVVEKLLNIINPDYLFIGQKDFQQCLVIRRLIAIMKKDIEIVICSTLRETSGLAMSSRNLRLNTSEKKLAAELYQSLELIKKKLTPSNFCELKKKAIFRLENEGFKIEYIKMAKTKDLQLVTEFENSENLIILIAAYLNGVRLIDNIVIKG